MITKELAGAPAGRPASAAPQGAAHRNVGSAFCAWLGAWLGAGSPWFWLSALVAVLVILPIASLALIAAQGSGDLWPHLMAYVLPQAARDTLILLGGVAVMVIGIGTGMAWLVTAYEFPGRRWLDWALLLPLAVPTYIVAFAYLDLMHPVGPVQSTLRDMLGIANPRDMWFPDIRSMGGCIFLLGLVLYPYVYLPARALFQMQAAGLIEASRTLGAGPLRSFFRVALPLARPAIAVGASLALMEAVNDIGAAEFLGVRTLTVSVYSTWINRSSLAGAAQIALFMFVILVSLIALERWARRRQRYAATGRQGQRLAPRRLPLWAGSAALFAAALPVLFGFILPAGYLATQAWKRIAFAGIDKSVIHAVVNTVSISAAATLLATVLAFSLAYSLRLSQGRAAGILVRFASMGYAIPGTVLALGLLAPLAWFDDLIGYVAQGVFGISTGLIFSASAFALVYAYVARFLAVGAGSVEAGFSKIPHAMDDAARSLGASASSTAWRIHLPLTRPAIIAAMLLIFVDCMKELPATLLLRPLNFESLATLLYGEASRGTYENGAVAALLIVLVGLIPIMLLSRIGRTRPAERMGAEAMAATPSLGSAD